jgi:hypothetical protein
VALDLYCLPEIRRFCILRSEEDSIWGHGFHSEIIPCHVCLVMFGSLVVWYFSFVTSTIPSVLYLVITWNVAAVARSLWWTRFHLNIYHYEWTVKSGCFRGLIQTSTQCVWIQLWIVTIWFAVCGRTWRSIWTARFWVNINHGCSRINNAKSYARLKYPINN